MHRLSFVAHDGHSHWWVCTCGSFGPTEDSHMAAFFSFQLHREEPA